MTRTSKTRDIKLVYQSRGIVGPDSGGGVGFNQPRLRSVIAEAPKMEMSQMDQGNQSLANAVGAGAAFAAGQSLINNREEIGNAIRDLPGLKRGIFPLNKEQRRAAKYGLNNAPGEDGEYGGLFRSGNTVPSSFVGRERGAGDFGTPRTVMREDRPMIRRMDPEEEGAIPSDPLPIPDTPRTMGLYSGARQPRDMEFEGMLGDFRQRMSNLYDRIDNPPKPEPKEVGETTEMNPTQTAVAQAPVADTSAVEAGAEGLAEIAPEIAEAALI